jgi:hypothetical protein
MYISQLPGMYLGDSGVESEANAGSRRQTMPPTTFVSVSVHEMTREKLMGWSGERILW